MRAKRFAVIKVGPPIPVSVPGVFLYVRLDLFRLSYTTVCKGRILAFARQFTELLQNVVEKEAEPDAFTAAVFPDQVHAIIPIARTHQGQPMLAESQPMFDGANAMLV